MLIAKIKKARSLLLISAMLALASCATIPDEIKTISPHPVDSLPVVQNAPSLYSGAQGRFGGKVVNVTNEQGYTLLDIATMPLDSSARPMLGEPSPGRLLAKVNGFLEPTDFKGHLITVVGRINGVQQGKIGASNYPYVTLDVTGYKRWRVTEQIIMPPEYIGPGWGWHDPWGPDWGWYMPGPAYVQPVVTE